MRQDCNSYNLFTTEKGSSSQFNSLVLCGVSFKEVKNELRRLLQYDLDDSNVKSLNDNLIRVGKIFLYEETLNNALECSARIDECLKEMDEANFPEMWKFGKDGSMFFIEGLES